MVNLQNVKAKSGSTWHTICPFPVGFIYMSYTGTSPASIFGGQWSPITGRFPYFNAGTSTGGSNTHTHGLGAGYAKLRWDFAGSPNIQFATRQDSWGSQSGVIIEWTDYRRANTTSLGTVSRSTALGGSTDGGNNMPQYQSCYCWRRTS